MEIKYTCINKDNYQFGNRIIRQLFIDKKINESTSIILITKITGDWDHAESELKDFIEYKSENHIVMAIGSYLIRSDIADSGILKSVSENKEYIDKIYNILKNCKMEPIYFSDVNIATTGDPLWLYTEDSEGCAFKSSLIMNGYIK